MANQPLTYIIVYLALISLVATVLTIYDKHRARTGSWRVKERTLLFVAALGGSIAMYVIMSLIRHKTKHKKFMIGIPVIIFLQIAVTFIIWWLVKGGTL